MDNVNSVAADLYLRLLKKSLTNTLHTAEPDLVNDSPAVFLRRFIDHYQKSAAVSMLPLVRLDHLQDCVVTVLKERIPGDVLEAGVWRGGAAILMRAVLKVYGVSDRCVWAADSFEGLPKPDAEKYPAEARAHEGVVMKPVLNHLAVSLEEVRSNFAAYDMLDEQVRFLKGWFKDTLPVAPIEKLAVMRLDGDYYESTMDGLSNLYDKLSPGGYAIIDDYGEDTWTYCRKAVDDFRREHGIKEPMIRVDSKCFFWQRRAPLSDAAIGTLV